MDTNQEYNQVMQRVLAAKQHVRDWHQNIDKWRALYDMRPTGSQIQDEYRDPTHTNAVDLAVGIMLANKMRWHSYGFSTSKQEQTDTGKIEKLLQATWDLNNQREERDNSYELILNFIRDGGGVIYSVFDPVIANKNLDAIELPDAENEEGVQQIPAISESPIRVQIVDPRKVFLMPGGPKRWLLIGRSEQMSVLDAQLNYPAANFEKYAHLTDFDKSQVMGTFMDVWDYVTKEGELKIRNTVLFDDIPLMGPRIMEGYEDLPYTIQFFKPAGTSPSSWMNIMSAQASSVELLERAVNRRSKQIDIFTALPLVSKTQTGRVVQVDGNLFNHVNLGTDESIEFPRWQGNAPDVQMHVDFLRSRVNQSGFSEVMFGMGGDSAGYAMSQMSDQNRIRLEQPIAHLELLLTTWAKKTLKLLSTFADGIAIFAYGKYKGKDFNESILVQNFGQYAVTAEIRPSFPAEDTRKVAMATQSKGLLSDYSIMERYYDIEQPEDEQERKLIEIVSANPMVIQYTIMAELTERAEDGDVIAAKVLEQMEQQATGDKGGRPEDPNNPTQFSNMPSPTGQLTSQEQGGPPAGQSASDKMARATGATPNMSGGI
jgi:hypothetical protein